MDTKEKKSFQFDELLAKSQRLNTQLGGDYIGIANPLKLGVTELSAANQAYLGDYDKRESDNYSAAKFLAQRSFDVFGLSAEMRTLEVPTQADQTERLDCTDLDGYLSHRHDMIILTALSNARKSAQDRERNIQKRWLLDNWSTSRKRFLESLGHTPQIRALVPSAPASSSGSGSSNAAQVLSTSVPASLMGTTSFRDAVPDAAAGGSGAANPAGIETATAAPPLPAYLDAHVRAIRTFNSDRKQSNSSKIDNSNSSSNNSMYSNALTISQRTPLFTALSEAAIADANTNTMEMQSMFGLCDADVIGYRSMLTMLSYITGEHHINDGKLRPSSQSNRGEFTSLCFPVSEFASPIIRSYYANPLSFGCKEYFEIRFNDKINRFIDENARNDRFHIGVSAEGQSWVTRLCSCLSHLLRHDQLYANDEDYEAFDMIYLNSSNSNSNSMNTMNSSSGNAGMDGGLGTVPLWAFVYYALAAGNIDAAIDILSEFGKTAIDKHSCRILQYFQQLSHSYLSTYFSGSDASTSDPSQSNRKEIAANAVKLSPEQLRELDNSLSECKEYFENEFAQDDVGHSDPYQLFVLNLLTLTRRDYLANPDFPNYLVENYLWSSVWFAYYHRLLYFCNAFSSNSVKFSKFAISANALDSESILLEEVQQFGGAQHFDYNGQSPFTYAIVLLCCGRFGDAINYIWSAAKTLPAVHVLVGCLHYGLVLPHVPLMHNPFVVQSATISSSGNGIAGAELTPFMLFNYFYNESFQQIYPEVALEYLMCLYVNPVNELGSQWQKLLKGVIRKESLSKTEIKARAIVLSSLEQLLSGLGMPQLRVLCGDISGEGKLYSGVLDEYSELGREEINLLLSRVAFSSLTVKNDSKRAIHFYKLCGRFTEALDELCHQLSNHICAGASSTGAVAAIDTAVSEERNYWVQSALQFYQTHINVGKSEALNALRIDGREDLSVCLRQLLDIYRFVELYQSKKFEDALVVIDSLRILPTTVAEVPIALNPFLSARNSINSSSGMQVAASAASTSTPSTSYYRYLLGVIDNIVIYYLICCRELMAMINEQIALSRSQFAMQSNLFSQYSALKERSKAIFEFVSKSVEQLFKLETRSIIAKLEFSD